MGINKGAPWGKPVCGPPDVTVEGDDATLARAAAGHPGARIALTPRPAADFARAIGLSSADPTTELLCDGLNVAVGQRNLFAVNMVVLGTPPDRQRWWSRVTRVRVRVDDRVVHDGAALAVVVANGQFLRGLDVVPRGHPGDGRVEVQVYALAPRERAAMRSRLALGTHVPHPRIRSAAGRRVEIHVERPVAVEIDGADSGSAGDVDVTVVAGAFSLLV
jgi:hypothetical protein